MFGRRSCSLIVAVVLVFGAIAGCSIDGDRFDTDPVASDGTDTDCLTDRAAGEEGAIFVSAYDIADGQLNGLCFGDDDDQLLDSWELLNQLVPAGQLRDLTTFSGFTAGAAGDQTTLAFVQAADDDGSQFEMSVNLDEAANDRAELARTLVHEFTHVFTAVPSELDRTVDPDDCGTYDGGEGCYRTGSVMADWHSRFWAEVPFDPSRDADEDGSAERCDADPGYFGQYAATSPEEDFAESFAAFAMNVEADTSGQQERLDWLGQFGGFEEFRTLAEQAGFAPQDNTFGTCGLG